MKYNIGGEFSNHHNGASAVIIDIREGLYYFDDDVDGFPESELDQWVRDGWVYTSPEVIERIMKKEADERDSFIKQHLYPKKG